MKEQAHAAAKELNISIYMSSAGTESKGCAEGIEERATGKGKTIQVQLSTEDSGSQDRSDMDEDDCKNDIDLEASADMDVGIVTNHT